MTTTTASSKFAAEYYLKIILVKILNHLLVNQLFSPKINSFTFTENRLENSNLPAILLKFSLLIFQMRSLTHCCVCGKMTKIN